MKLKTQKGITLIALIITIIVMLILVGVTVTVALNGGLFNTAKQATSETEKELEKERLLELAIGALDNKGKVDFNALKTAVDEDGTFEQISSSKTMGVYANKKTGNTYTVKSNGSIIEGETEIPTAKWTQSGDTLTYVDADGNTTNKTLTIGQSINYDEGTSGSYTTEASKGTGISYNYTSKTLNQGTYTVDGLAEGTIAAGDLSWMVLGVNDEGQVELISTTSTTNTLTLYGKEGYLNAITEGETLGTLDTFCNNLYGQNKEQAISARSIKAEDIYELADEQLEVYHTEYTYKYYGDRIYYIETSKITDENTNNISGWTEVYGVDDLGASSLTTLDWTIDSDNLGPETFISTEYSGDLYMIYENLPSQFKQVLGYSSGTDYFSASSRFIFLANAFASPSNGGLSEGPPNFPMYGICLPLISGGMATLTHYADLVTMWGDDLGSYPLHPIVTLKPDASILFE